MPSKKQMLPTVMYAHPKNGFFPPKIDVVEMMNDFDPENCVTG
jgi:hypothetical protein